MRNAARHLVVIPLFAAVILAVVSGPAFAQYRSRALVNPGDVVPAEALASQGGPAGRAVAPFVGKRPIVVVYWRPGDPLSEQALVQAYDTVSVAASKVAIFPVAFLASSQDPAMIGERLAELGMGELAGYQDGGQIGRLFGLKLPSFLLIDAGGVLRLVGGTSVGQETSGGVSVAEAMAMASRGAPVPTLGVMPSNPIYQLLGRQLPDAPLIGPDGATTRLREAIGEGKRAVIFYWLPTCGHCKRELPRLREWWQRNRPSDLVILDIAQAVTDPLQQQARAIVREYPWGHFLDTDRSAGRALKIRDTPTVFLVAPDGEIAGIRLGAGVDWDRWLGS